ncbi:carbamate kinase [Salisediminibacterium halotolerans]|uniref:Carbamate kinase n=1 Tax=Salisediminibacterium halotolerans TaxID=517425 RepID=A0A1H9W4C5_9BACI|nr:carbamate kinase [Salisediminibacterium haloalkalitolerans]SES28715.1 carbamate kinase [Salisediminibacterium haloalkalitolerans]
MSKIMLALGGNALGETPEEQLHLTKKAAVSIVNLIEQGHQVVLGHGNGPQVGMIHSVFEKTAERNEAPLMPFAECGAMSQGYIGYHLQNAVREELKKRSIERPVSSVITQVAVDSDDPAFAEPTKPVGRFFAKEEAEMLTQEKGWSFVEDSGRGYRRVVASPQPQEVIESETIAALVEQNHVVIAAGGGGIPVVRDDYRLSGIDAVIDKDFAASLLAEELDLDYLFVLTAVDQVSINFGTPEQTELNELSVDEAKRLIADGQFPPGSMLPKVEAALQFVSSNPERRAVISSLERAGDAIAGKTGTSFHSKACVK